MSFKNKTHRNRRYTTFAKLEACYFLRFNNLSEGESEIKRTEIISKK